MNVETHVAINTLVLVALVVLKIIESVYTNRRMEKLESEVMVAVSIAKGNTQLSEGLNKEAEQTVKEVKQAVTEVKAVAQEVKTLTGSAGDSGRIPIPPEIRIP